MNNRAKVLLKYIQHFFSARHTGGHGIHSPFVFHFVRFVVYEKNPFYVFGDIEKVRRELKADERVVSVTDLGMGQSGEREVKDIARKALKNPKFGQLLFRIVNSRKCDMVLELGTSLGVTTSYLASANSSARCVTMEGCPEIAKIARQNFDKLQLENVDIVVGDIDRNLTQVLDKLEKVDMVFIDANHRSEAVLNYFEKCLSKATDETVMVIDDIYWSDDMERAWKEIKEHEKTTATLDLFQLGIVFFNPDLEKKNYKIRF